MQINLSNPTIIISLVLIGVVLFNLALFSFAKRIGKNQHQHPIQMLTSAFKSFDKDQDGATGQAVELKELMTKVKEQTKEISQNNK